MSQRDETRSAAWVCEECGMKQEGEHGPNTLCSRGTAAADALGWFGSRSADAKPVPVERPPTLTVTVERTYRFDVERIMRDFGDDMRRDMAEFERDLDDVLRETFYELCGTWADRDHVDGSYVWLEDSDSTIDFGWDAIVKQAEAINDARA